VILHACAPRAPAASDGVLINEDLVSVQQQQILVDHCAAK
jgi:hypothetical protein